MEKTFDRVWKDVNKSIIERAVEARKIDCDKLMEQMYQEISTEYRTVTKDFDSINVKVDRRKNIDVIEQSIRGIVNKLVGCPKVASHIFKYRTVDGLIIIERRR